MEKIAIIDLGSNSVRMVLANVLEGGYFAVFDEIKETVRLGQDMDKDGFLKSARIVQAIKTLKMFRKLCDAYNVDKIIAVATNAVRRAKNQKSFLEEVNAVCGFKIQVLSQEEEARFIYQGVINSLDIPKGLIIDISGSSTQLIHYNRRNILHFENLPFGSVSLTSLFADDALTPEKQAEKIELFISEQLAHVEWLHELDPEVQLIGVGGAFRNLGKISRMLKRYSLDAAHNYIVPKEQFVDIYDMVKVLDTEKRLKIRGISAGRADIFVGALSVIKSIFSITQSEQVTISACGLREGLMYNYAVPMTAEKPIQDILGHSIMTIMKYFDENQLHAEQVYNLSMQLFKQLRVLHKLPRQYVKVLRIASLLHDAGLRIKYHDHHKHSFYVILNSHLNGLTHRELVIAAFVASAHRKEGLQLAEWVKFKDLVTDEDLIAARKLGVILRIAESLDRSMSGAVKALYCDVLGDSVIMKTEVEGDCSLEIKDALTSSVEFLKAFNKKLEIL